MTNSVKHCDCIKNPGGIRGFGAWCKDHRRLLEDYEFQKSKADEVVRRYEELEFLINNPHTANFLESVRLEAAHQRQRWGAAHDEGKADTDWFWLIGYLAGKAVSKPQKQLHHIITTAAACLNWHMARTVGNDMRPGIAEPASSSAKSEKL